MSRKPAESAAKPAQRKFIRVSPRKQITIPLSFYKQLGFRDEAECILREDGLLIRPVRESPNADVDDLILADLIRQGLSGPSLLAEFRKQRAQVRPAVERLLDEADSIAKGKPAKKG